MNQHTSVTTSSPTFAFFGTDEFAVLILEQLKRNNLTPSLIVTTPDTPQGRKLTVTPSPVKVWAKNNSTTMLQPEILDGGFFDDIKTEMWDVFIVASYGKIIPKKLLDIPTHGSLNIHPSLLPKLRGASPIQNAILHEDTTGVTIIQMDEKMDHGPIVAQKEVIFEEWPLSQGITEAILAREGGQLLADTLPDYISGAITPRKQDHDRATFTTKITKADAELDFSDPSEHNMRKIKAFNDSPRAFYFTQHGDKKIRVIVTNAHIDTNGELVFDAVIPEGKKEMSYEDFKRGLRTHT